MKRTGKPAIPSRRSSARPSSKKAPTSASSSTASIAEPHLHFDTRYAVAREVRTSVQKDGHPGVRWIYATYDRLNAEHFDGHLPPATILVSPARSPRTMADHTRMDEHGIQYRIRIAPAALKRGDLFVADVLLHEMVHVRKNLSGEPELGYRGHGPKFAAMCNAIGASLGLGREVGARDRRKPLYGKPLPDCAQWPVNVRPAGYYPPEPETPAKAKARARAAAEEGEGDQGDAGDGAGGSKTGRGGEAAQLRELARGYEEAITKALEVLDEQEDDFWATSAAGILRAALEEAERG